MADIHPIHMKEVCSEIKQKLREEKRRIKAMTIEEKQSIRSYYLGVINQLDAQSTQCLADIEDKERLHKKVIRDALVDWGRCVF